MKHSILLLFAYLLCSACSNSTTSKITHKPTLADFKAGEKMIFKWESTLNGVRQRGGTDVREYVDYKGEVALWTGFDTIKIATILNKKQSKTPYRDWPLEVGKKWKYESEWTNESGENGMSSQDAEIISYEELQLPAGHFMAYKIEYKGFIQNFAVGGKGMTKDTYWYAPALKQNIKHIQEGEGGFVYTNELIEYTTGE